MNIIKRDVIIAIKFDLSYRYLMKMNDDGTFKQYISIYRHDLTENIRAPTINLFGQIYFSHFILVEKSESIDIILNKPRTTIRNII